MTRLVALITAVQLLVVSTGVSGGAMRFDGVDDYVSVGNIGTFEDELSVSAWIKTDSYGQYDGFVGSWGYGFTLGYNDNIGTPRFRVRGDGNEDQAIASKLLNNKWYHLIGTYNGTHVLLYVDGVAGSPSEVTGSVDGGRDIQVEIGNLGSNYPTSYHMDGSIDEVLIYNRSLDASEVEAIYASRNAWYPRNGLISRWAMDDNGVSTGQSHANGSTVKDSAGSNDGTVYDGSDGSMTVESSPTRKKRGRR